MSVRLSTLLLLITLITFPLNNILLCSSALATWFAHQNYSNTHRRRAVANVVPEVAPTTSTFWIQLPGANKLSKVFGRRRMRDIFLNKSPSISRRDGKKIFFQGLFIAFYKPPKENKRARSLTEWFYLKKTLRTRSSRTRAPIGPIDEKGFLSLYGIHLPQQIEVDTEHMVTIDSPCSSRHSNEYIATYLKTKINSNNNNGNDNKRVNLSFDTMLDRDKFIRSLLEEIKPLYDHESKGSSFTFGDV